MLRPTLIINKKTCRKNIIKMAGKASNSNVVFRPHFKTHQSVEVGSWFKAEGISKITVSSVVMASYFAHQGWEDILIAFPVNILEIDQINQLASEVKLSLMVDSDFVVQFLRDKLSCGVDVYVKIDTGYHRTGIPANEIDFIRNLIFSIAGSSKMRFIGFLTHSGNTYQAKSASEVLEIHQESVCQLNNLKTHFLNQFPSLVISVGDTPSCSIIDDFSDVDEIRPGNFVYYDTMQYFLGSCSLEEIAACVVCPVVSKNSFRKEVVVYGGAVHLSKDFVLDRNGNKNFGLPVNLKERDWGSVYPDSYVSSLSQEHGIIKASDQLFEQINIGETIGIIPVHSCLTANLLKNHTSIV